MLISWLGRAKSLLQLAILKIMWCLWFKIKFIYLCHNYSMFLFSNYKCNYKWYCHFCWNKNFFWLSSKIIHILAQSENTVRILSLIWQLLFHLVVVLFVEAINCRLNVGTDRHGCGSYGHISNNWWLAIAQMILLGPNCKTVHDPSYILKFNDVLQSCWFYFV